MTDRKPDFYRGTTDGHLVFLGGYDAFEKFKNSLTFTDNMRWLESQPDREPVWLTTEPQPVPRIDEPTKVGTIVKISNGRRYIRWTDDPSFMYPWISEGGNMVAWFDLGDWEVEIVD